MTIIIAAGIPSGLLIAFLVFFVTNPDKLYFWLGKGLGLLAWASKSVGERSMASQIEGQVNAFRESVQAEAEGVLPYGLRIQWHSSVDPETFIQRDTVVVRMAHRRNPERNLVMCALSYCSRAVIPRARPYLDRSLLRSVDLVMTKKILAGAREASALNYFWENVLQPECDQNPQVSRYCIVMDGLEGNGFFTRILLREFVEVGRTTYPGVIRDTERFAEESKAFLEFLDALALRAPGELVDLGFLREHIRVGIILIARAETLTVGGLDTYVKWARIYRQRHAHTIYICARSYNIQAARLVAQAVEEEGHGTVISESIYNSSALGGPRRSAICITVRPSAS